LRWCHVAWQIFTSILEEIAVSIHKVEEKTLQGETAGEIGRREQG
jgi:hypothetical protein